MILPGRTPDKCRLVSVPEDMEDQEAYRCATGLIAQVEESDAEEKWAEIEDVLEASGFQSLPFLLGPTLD